MDPINKPTAAPTGPTVDRSTYLGGSQIGAVAGLDPYATALDVWAEIKGLKTTNGNTAMAIGCAKERPILTDVYAPEYGVELTFPGTLIVPDDPWRGATPDAIENGNIDVQFKSVGRYTARQWGDPDEGPDGVPAQVLAQVHWEAEAIAKFFKINVELARVVTEYGNQLNRYDVPIDQGFTDGLIKIGHRFWIDHIVGDTMPNVEGDPEGVRDILGTVYPRVLRKELAPVTDESKRLATAYADFRQKEADAKAAKIKVGNKLQALIGDGYGIEGDGVKVLWSEKKGTPKWKSVAEECGATQEQIDRHKSDPSRTLKVTVKEESHDG